MPTLTRDPPHQIRCTLQLGDEVRSGMGPAAILVVDHDAAVRDALSLTLKSNGFDVHAFGSAGELLSRLPVERARCLLIEFDLNDMTAPELLARLIGRRIQLPAIIMSARLRPLVLDSPRPPCITAILQKPFGQDALLRCLEHALTDH